MKKILPRVSTKSVKILQTRYKAELEPLNFDVKKFTLEMGQIVTDHKNGILSLDPTVGRIEGGVRSPVGAGGTDIGPIGPINKQAAFLDANTTKLYNTLASGLVKSKMEYRFVHHLRRNDTLNTGFVSEKMILNAISSTYKESQEDNVAITQKLALT